MGKLRCLGMAPVPGSRALCHTTVEKFMSDDLPPGSRRSASPGNAAPTQPQNRAGAGGGRDAAPPDTAGGTQNADSQAGPFPDTLPSPSVPKPASWQDATLDGPPPNTEVSIGPWNAFPSLPPKSNEQRIAVVIIGVAVVLIIIFSSILLLS